MILSDALQILRENIGITPGDTYTFGDTILTKVLESCRAFIVENAPSEKVPLCQIQASAALDLTTSVDYRAFEAGIRMIDLTDNSGVISGAIADTYDILDFSEKIQIEDNSASEYYNGRLYTNHINAMVEVHKSSYTEPIISEDFIPVLYDGLWFQVRQDFTPGGPGWTSSDRIHIRIMISPDPLNTTIQTYRLPERYENYAIELAYAEIMLTAVGDPRYKNIEMNVLKELGIIKSGSEL